MNQSPGAQAWSWHVLAFSADTLGELERVTGRLSGYVQQHPEHALAEVSRALAAMPRRSVGRVLVSGGRDDALDALAKSERQLTGDLTGGKRSVAFLFPGLGEQYVHMARELYQVEALFRECVDTCAEVVRPLLDVDLREVLRLSGGEQVPTGGAPQKVDLRSMLRRGAASDGGARSSLAQTYLAQPATFMIEYALARLWMSWGIAPDAMLGYSIGEYVAACLAGVLSLPDALRLVSLRARLIQGLPAGGMLAVPRPEREVGALLGDELSVAAINGEALCVVAGPPEAIERLQAQLNAGQEPAVRIQTTHAFHSRMMEPIVGEFRRIVETCALRPPRIPYVSNVTGAWITEAEATDPAYWTAHLCKAVRFHDGLKVLWRDPARVFVEVGPGRALSTLALHNAPGDGGEHTAVHSLRSSYEAVSDQAVLLNALGRLWLAGVPVEWERILGPSRDEAGARALQAHLAASPTPAGRAGADASSEGGAASAGAGGRGGWRPRPQLFTAYVPPKEELEKRLAQLWRQVLKMETVGVNDDFFELGGHSLLAISIIGQLEGEERIKIPLTFFFEHPTIAQFAQGYARLLAQGGSNPRGTAEGERPAAGRVTAHHSQYTLPNGLVITHQNKAETDHFYEDIFEHRTYVRHLERLPEDACIFDVGANIGLFSLFVHTLQKKARIYAFEPSAPTFEILRENISRHGVNAKLFDVGLSDEEKTADFTFYPLSSGMSSVYGDKGEERAVLQGIMQNQMRSDPGGLGQVMAYSEELLEQRLKSQRFTCRLRPISSVISEEGVERIDLLKIDVQKSELDVLRGIQPGDWRRIRSIAMEVHDLDGRLRVVEELLKQHEYQVEILQDDLYRGTGIYLVYAR